MKEIFAQITKTVEQPDGTCKVFGTAAAEVVDKTKEIMDYATARPQIEKWRDEAITRSDGKSQGNIRAMHGKIAAGKATGIEFNDANKTVDIATHIIDPVEAKKCMEGVYTGFSVGGDYLKRWPDPDNKGVMRYTPSLSEISLVDNPCIPSAVFSHVKLDQTVELRKFAGAEGGLSARRGRLSKPTTEKYASDQARDPGAKWAPQTTDEGGPHTANILRGKATAAGAEGKAPEAASLHAEAASHDASNDPTPENHDRAADLHQKAADAHGSDSPAFAMIHGARAAYHKNAADGMRAAQQSETEKIAKGDSMKTCSCGKEFDGKTDKCEMCMKAEKLAKGGKPMCPACGSDKYDGSTGKCEDCTKVFGKLAKRVCPECGDDDLDEDGCCPKCGYCEDDEDEVERIEGGDPDLQKEFLVTEPDGKTHLPVNSTAQMGAAWAALHSNYRGQPYSGPDKEEAKTKLKALYESKGMDLPSEKWEGPKHMTRLVGKKYTTGSIVKDFALLARADAEKEALKKASEQTEKGGGQQMATSNLTNELAERLHKATPETLNVFAGNLVKRAEHMAKVKDGFGKAAKHHEDLMDNLDKMKDAMDDKDGDEDAAKKNNGVGLLNKVEREEVDTALLDSYKGVLTAAKGIGEAHDLIHGAIEEYESEANARVDEGLAAATQHPTAPYWDKSEKMAKGFQRQMEKMNKDNQRSIAKMQKDSDRRLSQIVGSFTGGFTAALDKAAPQTGSTQQVPARFAVEKSADGTGMVIKVAGQTNGNPITVALPVSPVLADGITPNPEFTKSTESQGDAVQKVLVDLKPQSGNPFFGIEQLMQRS